MIEDCKKAAPILLVWLTASTIIYLKLYWSAFSINPFEYISLSEVINYSGSYFLAAATVPIILGIFEYIFPSRLTEKTFENDALAIRALAAFTLIVGVISLVLLKYWPKTEFIFYALTPVIAGWGARTKPAKGLINSHALRFSLIAAIVLSPYIAISSASEKSLRVKSDEVKAVKLSGIKLFDDKRVIVVGRLGEYTFVKQMGLPVIHAVLSQEIKSIEFLEVPESQNQQDQSN